jgi:3-oxoacyl-[acyl-carrier-protein] synthase I
VAAEEVVVGGAGLLTAVGLSAPETAGSVESGVMRFEEIDWLDRGFEPFTLATVAEENLPPLAEALQAESGLTTRETRLLRLAAPALAECLEPLAQRSGLLSVIMALPDAAGSVPIDPKQFLGRLKIQSGLRLDLAGSTVVTKGRAGGLIALELARRQLSSGGRHVLAVGGVDSYLDPYLLGTLDLEGRIKSERHLDGFIPGEGAAFLSLTSRRGAEAAGLKALATLAPGGESFEKGHFYSPEPYLGDGLATALQGLFDAARLTSPVLDVYSSMNGESHWAKEWGVALLRNKDAIAEAHAIHHPADCYGDLGAAAGPAMTILAVTGLRDRSWRSPTLVYASSDRGERAAIALMKIAGGT